MVKAVRIWVRGAW